MILIILKPLRTTFFLKGHWTCVQFSQCGQFSQKMPNCFLYFVYCNIFWKVRGDSLSIVGLHFCWKLELLQFRRSMATELLETYKSINKEDNLDILRISMTFPDMINWIMLWGILKIEEGWQKEDLTYHYCFPFCVLYFHVFSYH